MTLSELQEENRLLKENIVLMQEIQRMKANNAKLQWPKRMADSDPDLFRGMCIS